MKEHIKNEIERAARESGISLKALTDSESFEIRRQLATLFGRERDSPYSFSYQTLKVYETFHSPDSWKLAPAILGSSPVLFFLNPDESMTVWELESSDNLYKLLAESFGFVFYAATSSLEGLVSVDDHDILYGVGICQSAVRALKG